MKKGTTLKMAEDSCAVLHRHDITCYNSIIIGAEGETLATLLSSIIFAKKLHAMICAFMILVPIPGTPVFEKYYKDYDRPDTDWTHWSSFLHKRPYPHRHTTLSWGTQKFWQVVAFAVYYLDPIQMLRMFASTLSILESNTLRRR